MNHFRKTLTSDAPCENLISELLVTNNSTSKRLEEISKKILQIEVLTQGEVLEKDQRYMIRTSKLFFNSPGLAIIYCISNLSLNVLLAHEVHLLKEGRQPIGKIFGVDNIYKSNISVEKAIDPSLATILNINDQNLFHKEYTIHINERKIGTIKEVFNKESIVRIWS